jgi:DNA (cytosine-5)-methyltransferase 1
MSRVYQPGFFDSFLTNTAIMSTDRPIAVDLFSGAGGLTRGLLEAEFTVLGAVEIDSLAAKSYAMNFPEVTLWERDISSVSGPEMMRRLGVTCGDLDLLAGCPPCEGFSRVRTLNGARSPEDPRNDLVLRMAKFVKCMLPKAVMVENVPALASDYRIVRFTNTLVRLGYEVRCEVIDTSDFGVPQRRRRMILLASRLGSPPPHPRPQPPVTVREAIGHLPSAGSSGDPLHDHGERRSKAIRQLISRIPRNGGGRLDLTIDDQLECHRSCDGFRDVYGRMSWDTVAPTITGGCINPSKGRFLHPEEDRAITLREAALLQTFPMHHYFSLARGKYAAAELIGNALPPRLVALQASVVREHLDRSGRPH